MAGGIVIDQGPIRSRPSTRIPALAWAFVCRAGSGNRIRTISLGMSAGTLLACSSADQQAPWLTRVTISPRVRPSYRARTGHDLARALTLSLSSGGKAVIRGQCRRPADLCGLAGSGAVAALCCCTALPRAAVLASSALDANYWQPVDDVRTSNRCNHSGCIAVISHQLGGCTLVLHVGLSTLKLNVNHSRQHRLPTPARPVPSSR